MPKTIFKFTEEDNGQFSIFYDYELDMAPFGHKTPAAMMRLMKENPELIEEMLNICIHLAENLSQPFNDILNEKA